MKYLLLVLLLKIDLNAQNLASWYGEEHRGKIMANGKPFNPDRFTCASWYHPLGSTLRVYHGNKIVDVVVTDRGPNKRFKNRKIDLSAAAFSRLHDKKVGLINVTIKRIR